MAETSYFDPLPELHASADERIELLQHVLPEAWDYASSTVQSWRPERPAQGQEFATAAVLLDYCGGLVLERTVEQAAEDGFTYSNVVQGRQLFIREGMIAVGLRPSASLHLNRTFELRHRLELMDTYPKLKRYQALRMAVDQRMGDIDHFRERERQRHARLAAAS